MVKHELAIDKLHTQVPHFLGWHFFYLKFIMLRIDRAISWGLQYFVSPACRWQVCCQLLVASLNHYQPGTPKQPPL